MMILRFHRKLMDGTFVAFGPKGAQNTLKVRFFKLCEKSMYDIRVTFVFFP